MNLYGVPNEEISDGYEFQTTRLEWMKVSRQTAGGWLY